MEERQKGSEALEAPPAAVVERAGAVDRQAYPFASRWLRVPAGWLHYVDEGAGEPLLFVHGTPTWSFEWRALIRALAPTHRCIALDHLGFGLSERPRDGVYSPEAHAANLETFVEKLDPEPLTLVVHDFGGPIGLPLCMLRPERVRRLVLLNTWMWSLADDRALAPAARLLRGRLGRLLYRRANLSLRVLMPLAFGDRTRLTPELHRQYLDRFPDRWARGEVLWPLARALLGSSAFYHALWRQREALRGRPALVLWGLRDRAFPRRLLERWREALPDARFVELPDAGHWPHEETPEQVIRELRAFLAEGSGAG